MNLTWHVARKDLCRFWGPLAMLSAITLVRIGVGIGLLNTSGSDATWFKHMTVYSNVLWGVGLFVTYTLVAVVIQEDSVASLSFWQTRPISGSRLLAAKALGLVLMVGLLPVLLSLPWWLCCGFGFSEICGAAAETLAVQVGVVLLALPFAVVSGQIGRFLIWTTVAVIGWITLAVVIVARDSTPWHELSVGTMLTRHLLILLLVGAGGLVVTFHQFLARRTWRSIALIVGIGVLVACIGRWSNWDASAYLFPKPAAPTGPAKDISITFENAFGSWKPTDAKAFATVGLSVDHLPAKYALAKIFSEQDLKWADGTVNHQARFDMGVWGGLSSFYAHDALRITPGPDNREWTLYTMRRRLIPLSRLVPQSGGRVDAYFFLELSPQEVRRLQREKPEYEATFWFRLLQAKVVGERGIGVGGEFEKGSIHTRVAAIDDDEQRHVLVLSLIERAPANPWADFLEAVNMRTWRTGPTYCIVNRSRTDARDGTNDSKDRAFVDGVAITMRKDGFSRPQRWNSSARKWEREPEGLEGATLAEVEYQETERFSLPLEIRSLPLDMSIEGEPFDRLARHAGVFEPFSVTGEVGRAGTYSFPKGATQTVVNALQRAAGASERADLSRVTLTRTAADGSSSVIQVNVESWLEGNMAAGEKIPALQSGDVVNVPAMEPGQPTPP